MTVNAEGSRHLKTIRHDRSIPWHWTALKYGHCQPPKRFVRWSPRGWQFHFTPVHIERDGQSCEVGVCVGKRTLYVKRHR